MNTKIEIASELFKNTTNTFLKEFIKDYISNIDNIENTNEQLLRLNTCVSYIQSVGFDIRGWRLNDIPIWYAHAFYHATDNKSFDLDVFDIGVKPTYLDENSNEQYAASIEEAIEKFVWPE